MENLEDLKLISRLTSFGGEMFDAGVFGMLLIDNTLYFEKQQDIMDEYFKKLGYSGFVRDNGGNFNGYVVLSEDSPLFGLDYQDINRLLSDNLSFSAHGGLSFSETINKKENKIHPVNSLVKKYFKNNRDKTLERALWSEIIHADDFKKYHIVGFHTRYTFDTPEIWTEQKTWEHTEEIAINLFNLSKILDPN